MTKEPGKSLAPGMRPVSELHGRHPGSDIYVIGTGASRESLRSFQNRFEYPAK